MRTMFLAVTVVVLSLVGWPSSVALAQEQHTARGVISEMTGSSLTIAVNGAPMTFAIDAGTQVEARGASTKSRQLAASGKPGPGLADILTVGQPVAVSYRSAAGTPRASLVRVVPRVVNGGSVTTPEMRSIGTVKSLAADSITIVGGSGAGASFTQTFRIGADTKVIGQGIGTAAAAKGGRAPFSDLVAVGDKVTVSYHQAGEGLQASAVRVIAKRSN